MFFVLLFHSPLSLRSDEQAKLKITSSKLIVLDEAPEIDQKYDQYRYDEAKNSRVVVYSVMMGYKDSKGDKYLPFFKISIKKVDKYILRVDFLSLQTTTVEFRMIMEGVNFVPNKKGVIKSQAYEDKYGHGTWTSGIAGAVDNTIGTIGVAPQIEIIMVKIGDNYPNIFAIINNNY